MWTALYLPTHDGRPDPSKFDCESETAAWDFVYSHMCATCKEERGRALAKQPRTSPGMEDDWDSADPACSCEWMVLPTEDYEKL